MALIFQDGFEVWGSGSTSRTNMLNSSNMWTSLGTGFGCTTTNPRTGTYSLKYTKASNNQSARFSLGGTKTSASGYFGFGAGICIDQYGGGTQDILEFLDTGGGTQLGLAVTATGALALYRGTQAGTLLTTSAGGIITLNTYHFIEVKVKVASTVSATDGEFYCRVNGSQVIGLTGVDMIAHASLANMDRVEFCPIENIWNAYLDDLFVWDSTGTTCNDWMGIKAVYTYFPNADTATADWSITGTTQGFDAIDDGTPDADTTYIAATAVNQTSNFELPTVLSTLTGIRAVSTHTTMRQASAGSSELQVSLLSGVTYAAGTSRVPPFPGATSTTYTAYQDHFYTDPGGAGALTPTLVSAMQVRLKRTV